MRLLSVLIQHKVSSLNRPFSYVYNGLKNVDVGHRVLINFSSSRIVGYVINVEQTTKTIDELEKESGYHIEEIIDVIDDKPLLNEELMKLATLISEYYLCPLIAVYQTMLPTSLKPSISSLKGPKIAFDKYVHLINDDETDLTPKQIELIRRLKSGGDILKRDIKNKSIITKLLSLSRIVIVDVEKHRLNTQSYTKEKEKTLSVDQQNALDNILHTDKSITLLQGVTGSGKTEVYLALSKSIIDSGRNVLMLVPEISLTPVMVAYFKKRFDNKVAILHSELTPAEKYDEYRRIARGDARIVVGARSAIFAPLNNIGLIILDEEHVESYKQDNVPHYHAREVAIMRAKMNDAKIVLGSATPSLESKARALKGVYNYVEMKKRINEQALPETIIIDMAKASNLSRESGMFSKQLINSIKDVLAKNEQAILLINRRGYSGYITCRNCGHIYRCPDCDIALTYHKDDNMLKCHNCGHVELFDETCPKCGSHYFMRSGFGTERIALEINKLFPEARVLRLDSDVGQVRNNIVKTIEAFSKNEADILVGTQMIAKGHDFPNVTLVGVVLADIGLSLPSFRSSERAFELITQAVGRSGRSLKAGKAIIQTYNPTHYAIRYASEQNYEKFFNKEMRVRKMTQYPPYTFLISVEVVAKKEEIAIRFSDSLVSDLEKQCFDDVTILGPISPYIARQKETYRRLILIKYKSCDIIKQYLKRMLAALKNKSGIDVRIDVDPYGF